MRRMAYFFAGVGIAGIVAYGAYKVFIEPTIKEQQQIAQALWERIRMLELRVGELERGSVQDEEEHRLLKNEIDRLRQTSITSEMKSKLEELLALLDAISQHQVSKPPSSSLPTYVL